MKRSNTTTKSLPIVLSTGCIYILYLLIAIESTVTSTLLPDIMQCYALSLSSIGFLTAIQSAGQLVSALLGILIADRFNKRKASALIVLLFSISLIGLGTKPVYPIVLFLFFIRGMGISLSTVYFNAMISDIYQSKRNIYINYLHIFYGVGSSLGPLASALFFSHALSWNHIYTLIGICCVCAVLIHTGFAQNMSALSVSVHPKADTEPGQPDSHPFNYQILFLGILMFCYNGHQVSMNNWIPTYLSNAYSVTSKTGALALSFYWGSVLIGRFLYNVLFSKTRDKTYIFFSCLITGFIMLFGILSSQVWIFMLCLILGGITTGAVYPLLFSLACSTLPTNSAFANSVLSACGQLGGLLFTWLIGIAAQYISFLFAFLLIIGLLLVIPFMLGLKK